MKHGHYFKDVAHLSTIDVYRVLDLFGVVDPCLQHAIKKLMVAGGRGHKAIDEDVTEAIDTLVRWQNMRHEDEAKLPKIAKTGEVLEVPAGMSLRNFVAGHER